MKLFLLRHGKADWPDWKGPDADRPLTDEGVQEMRRVASALKGMKIRPDVILASPLPRALRTAEITAKALGVPLEQRAELKPGFDRGACDTLLITRAGADVMMVGHEPDLGNVIRSFTGGRVKLPKAALAAIEIGGELAAPRLISLFPAKMLIRLYG